MNEVKRYAIISDNWDYVESPTGGFVDRDDYAVLEAECERLLEVVSSLIDIAHEHRRELQQQRFSDNDEGDAFARHRDSRVGRIDRILRAALAGSTGQEVES